MTHGAYKNKQGQFVEYGFEDIQDWLLSIFLSFPAPWEIGTDTHYGSEIIDARGKHIFSVWIPSGKPSARQKCDMSDAEWAEYCCDSHWESETQWHIANAIVSCRNQFADPYDDNREKRAILIGLILTHGIWSNDVGLEVVCGGPNRRLLIPE